MNAKNNIAHAIEPDAVIDFWRAAGFKKWFGADMDFDAAIRDRFEETHLLAAKGGLTEWEDTPQGALALLLLTDQFSRNLYRGSAHAFATDPLARGIADRAWRATSTPGPERNCACSSICPSSITRMPSHRRARLHFLKS